MKPFTISFFTTKALLLLAVLFFFAGCDSFVDVDQPGNQLTSATVFEDNATATAAMTDIYSKMRDGGLFTGLSTGLSNQLGAYADELVFYGDVSAPTQEFYQNALVPGNGSVSAYWNHTYNLIYAANAVYEGVNASTQLLEADKKQLKGEALFARALLHLYLVNLYGDVPYVNTTDYLVNRNVSRMATDEVYSRIIADLEQASTLLADSYPSAERVRPNRYAAMALLARVYLYHGDWAEASNAASAVLNESGTYSFTGDLDTEFLKGSTATIWQFMPSAAGKNTEEGSTFIFESGPPPVTGLRPEFVSSFETGDARRSSWIGEVTDGSTTWYFPNKYKQSGNSGSSLEYSIVLHLGEVYLIRAEARARQGELTGAQEDLDVIRSKAGLAPTAAVTQQDLIAAVLDERKHELFTEFGHRFFDLKRFGTVDATLGSVKAGWSNTDILFPLPQTELNANPNLLPQNPGY